MLTTHTGNFPIGFRRGNGAWQQDLNGLIAWAISHELGVIDLRQNADEVEPVVKASLKVGSMDLLDWKLLFSPDAAKRADTVAANASYIEKCGAAGVRNFFIVVLPEDPNLPRAENFGYAVESFNALSPHVEKVGGRIVIEGWPGPGAQLCTPETYRAAFRECPSQAIGINYDPSHLLRMGIDPIRFLKEFAPRVGHVHGKDTEILADDLYEYGWEQKATFKPNPAFGSSAWRYTIPGHGNTNWPEVFRILVAHEYSGAVSIELEDKNYNGSEDGEKLGLRTGARYLSMC